MAFRVSGIVGLSNGIVGPSNFEWRRTAPRGVMMPPAWRLVAVAMGQLLSAGLPLQGQPAGVPTLSISNLQLGIGGVARVGAWIPVSAELSGDVPAQRVRVSWLASDPAANECAFIDDRDYEVSSAGTRVASLVRLGRASPVPTILVLSEQGREITRKDWTRSTRARIVPSTCGVILDLAAGLELADAIKTQSSLRNRDLAIGQVTDLRDVPDDVLAYDSIDLVVLSLAQRRLIDQLTERHWDALSQWVQGGGRLVVFCNPDSSSTPKVDRQLAELIEISVTGVDREKDTTGLEDFAGVDQRLDVAVRQSGQVWEGLSVVRLAPSAARVFAFDGLGAARTNWVQQSTAGLGIVTVVNFNLGDPVLAPWSGAPRLLGRIVELAMRVPSDTPGESRGGQLAHWGYDDLVGQLRMALDQIPGVRRVSFSVVAVAIGVYVVLVSAGDYLLHRQILGNFTWTWLTLPILIIAASLAGYGWTAAWKGRGPQSSQMDFLDVDPVSGTMRWHSWCHYYSPQARRVDLQWQTLPAQPASARERYRACSWEGMPGTGFGAMESRAALGLFRQRYRSERARDPSDGASQVRLRDFPMPAWSSHGFEGMGLGQRPPTQESALQADTLSQLRGTIRNPLPIRLRDCGVCFDRWYYEIGTLEPDAQFELTARNQPLDLKARLTRKRIVDAKEVTSPWDPASTDLARIAEMIMFHEAAGGTLFTGLRHEFRNRLDLSAHLLLNSAVVVGRPAEPVAAFRMGPDSDPVPSARRAAYLRFLVPVERPGPLEGTRP